MNRKDKDYYISPKGKRESLKTLLVFIWNFPYIFLISIGYGITLKLFSKLLNGATAGGLSSGIISAIVLSLTYLRIVSFFSIIIGKQLHKDLVKKRILNRLFVGVNCIFYTLFLEFIYISISLLITIGENGIDLKMGEGYSLIFSIPYFILLSIVRIAISTLSMYPTARTQDEIFCNKCNDWVDEHNIEMKINNLEEDEFDDFITKVKTKDFSKLLSMKKSENEERHIKITILTCGKCFSDYYLNIEIVQNAKKNIRKLKIDRLIISKEEYENIKNHIFLEVLGVPSNA